ncbi:MAG: hypothetical protein IVW55_03840 [Chloroflexi bacterium]|nr:hypothetical protein [Chloroflexota bacterium]
MKQRLLSLTFLLLTTMLATGCILGPRPVLQSYQAVPPPQGSDQPFKVEAVVQNQGPGSGQVAVVVNLKNKQTGETIAQDEKDVSLEKDETQRLTFSLDLPPSAKGLDPKNIIVDVQAHYPIE